MYASSRWTYRLNVICLNASVIYSVYCGAYRDLRSWSGLFTSPIAAKKYCPPAIYYSLKPSVDLRIFFLIVMSTLTSRIVLSVSALKRWCIPTKKAGYFNPFINANIPNNSTWVSLSSFSLRYYLKITCLYSNSSLARSSMPFNFNSISLSIWSVIFLL